jgi:type IV secretory pathway VirB10-like protein
MADQTPQSPDSLQLRTKPLASARLSRKAVLTVIGALAGIMGVVIVNVSKGKPVKTSEQAVTRELQPALNAAKDLTRDVPDFIAAPAWKPVEEPPQPPPVRIVPLESRDKDARLADTAVTQFTDVQHTELRRGMDAMSEESPQADASPEANPYVTATPSNNEGRPLGGLLRTADRSVAEDPGINPQSEKQAFLRQSRHSAYLDSQLTPPRSLYELKTGTVIPATMISAMNSDLPGEIIAQVTQNVYDTATGKYLVIPQGSKLFGVYDSKVSYGQSRALVSWQRLIYPNAYTLELGGMSGHDEAGEAGFSDRINHHYGRIFGWALMTSVLSAGAQLSQPQQANSLVPSNGQVAAASVGQQMTQLGAQITSRNIQVQPTLEIRKGYRMNVMVNKDIVFPGVYQP